jgi:hypothetical protein
MGIDRSVRSRHHGQQSSRSWVRWLLLPVLVGLVALQPSGTRADSTWQTMTNSLTTARQYLGGANAPCPGSSSTTCVYAIGGYNGSYLNSVEYYDPSTGASGSWQTITSLTTTRDAPGAASAPCPGSSSTTCLYAIGGFDGSYLNSVEYYDPSTGTSGSWHTITSLTTARDAFGAASAPCPGSSSTCLYAIGGYNGSDLNSVEYYDLSTGTSGSWTTMTNSLTMVRHGLAAASAPCPGSSSTCLYAIGGANGGSDLSSVEYDDPSAGATMALLTHEHLQRSGGRLTISWCLADRAGVIGFEVDGGGHRLTWHRIPVHASARYRVVLHTHVTGAVSIQVVHSNGSRSSLPVRSRRHGRS